MVMREAKPLTWLKFELSGMSLTLDTMLLILSE